MTDCTTLLELLRDRRSVRQFTEAPVTREQIDQIVTAAGWAPSNHNRQGWKFVVFTDPSEIASLADRCRDAVGKATETAGRLIARQKAELVHFAGSFADAPVVILAMHKASPAIGKPLLETAVGDWASGELLSTAMAVANLLLAAQAVGLGACVMTAPLLSGDVWRSVSDLPAGFAPTCLVAVGHPGRVTEPPRKKSLEHIIEYR